MAISKIQSNTAYTVDLPVRVGVLDGRPRPRYVDLHQTRQAESLLLMLVSHLIRTQRLIS